jgi:DNA-binding PadR family transcriptional regulator
VILDLIKDKPRYGYEVIRALEEHSHGFYSPSPGVVYPTLQMLEEMGHASVVEQDGKKVYSITEAGSQFLAERKDLADEVKSHMWHHWNPENIGAIGQGKMMARRMRHADPEKTARIREVVSRASGEIEAILGEKGKPEAE